MTRSGNKSINNPQLPNDITAVHIATTTENWIEKKFPPPIHHKLVGFAALTLSKEEGHVRIVAQSLVDNEAALLTTLQKELVGPHREVINFIPHRLLLPVLRGVAYRTGVRHINPDAVKDVGAWFGSDYTSISDCAVAAGLESRLTINPSVALRDHRRKSVEDHLLVDVFLMLLFYLRQRVVEDPYFDLKTYRALIERARRAVRGGVDDIECKKYLSKKGARSRNVFLLK